MDRAQALNTFLLAWVADQRNDARRPLEAYLALVPPVHADVITLEYARLVADEENRPAPHCLGPYRLIEEIGRGGQGVVWRAEDPRLKRLVALKVLSGLGFQNKNSVQRFRREAQVASRLDLPGICTVFETGTDDGVAWIAMRLIEGQSLARQLQGRAGSQIPPTRSELTAGVRLIEACARTLHAAHEEGIVHRDVKPGNIMIGLDGAPVILDFGLARDLSGDAAALTQSGDILGTPAYMAPEQLDPQSPAADRQADVWALGVTLYQIACGTRPFSAATEQGLCQAVLTREPPRPRLLNPCIGRDLGVVIETALQKDMSRRYATALDLAEDLRRVAAHEPIVARPAGPLLRFRRWVERNPAVSALTIGLFALLLGGLVLVSILLQSRQRTIVEKDVALAEYRQLADLRRVSDLLSSFEGGLWPRRPEKVALMDSWLTDVDAVLGRRAQHEDAVAVLTRKLAGSRLSREETTEALWRRGVLEALLHDLDLLGTRRQQVVEMRGYASTVHERSVDQPAEAWRACLADLRGDPRFAGVVMEPQLDLVPLRKNPASGLWEFAFLACGPAPKVVEGGKELCISDTTTLVFVLVPGGTVLMGSQKTDRLEPMFDPAAGDVESVVNMVKLDPFFVSKYEMTQGQWRAFTGTNPSYFAEGKSSRRVTFSLRHPVEQVTWGDASRTLMRLGLALPTEAQWEYACRAGTRTVFSSGDSVASLTGCANIADEGSKLPDDLQWDVEPGFDDGYDATSPVGVLRPNPFGLHDMHGNVSEWCRDGVSDYATPARPGDGLREGDGRPHKVERGGSYAWPAVAARSSVRVFTAPDVAHSRLGLRPVRPIEAGTK